MRFAIVSEGIYVREKRRFLSRNEGWKSSCEFLYLAQNKVVEKTILRSELRSYQQVTQGDQMTLIGAAIDDILSGERKERAKAKHFI